MHFTNSATPCPPRVCYLPWYIMPWAAWCLGFGPGISSKTFDFGLVMFLSQEVEFISQYFFVGPFSLDTFHVVVAAAAKTACPSRLLPNRSFSVRSPAASPSSSATENPIRVEGCRDSCCCYFFSVPLPPLSLAMPHSLISFSPCLSYPQESLPAISHITAS